MSSVAFDTASVAEAYQRYLEPVLFAPWAHRLVAYAGVKPGDVVLDLAAGTGAVARVAARSAGPDGAVIASDVSPRMLALAASSAPRSAPISTLVSPAAALDLPDASVDVVLCQQGLQFVPDAAAVMRECLRVLRPGGTVAVSVWAAGERLEPFDVYAEALQRDAVTAGSDRTFTNDSVEMSVLDIVDTMLVAGARDVAATRQQLGVRWPTVDSEVAALFGTPFGSYVGRLSVVRQERVLSDIGDRLSRDGRTVEHITTSVVARASNL